MCLGILGRYNESIEALDRAISINPQLAEARFNKGMALYYQGKYEEAVSAWMR